jgi:transposase
MGKYSEVYVTFDTAKLRHAVAIAEAGREGEVRFLGEIENRPATIERLARRWRKLRICFEAGPRGYGLCRQVQALGHDCLVVAPSLIPRRSGERVKTNRRDAITLARLFRAGELSAVWVPDDVHEAARDLVRGRLTAAEDVRRKRRECQEYCVGTIRG